MHIVIHILCQKLMNFLFGIWPLINLVKLGPNRETVERTMITKTDQKYFQKAYQTALLSDYHKTHVGCVAVYQGSIISIGCNTIKNITDIDILNTTKVIRHCLDFMQK